MPQAREETGEDPDTYGCLVLVGDRRQTAGQRDGGGREREKEGVTERRNTGDTKGAKHERKQSDESGGE